MRYLEDVSTLKLFPEKCTGCGRCAEVCPHGVFALNKKKAEITDRDLCMECGACAMNCAFGAISVNAGVGCATAFINGFFKGTGPDCGCGGASEKKSACC